jgi:translation initiation factor 5
VQFVKDEQAQKLVLFCWESLCEVEESLISKSAIVLKGLYDADVLEEEVILKWNKHAAKKISAKTGEAVRAAAAKFVEWLQTAEEDDE